MMARRSKTWLVNWQVPDNRMMLRISQVGRIEMQDGAFKVELQSLTEAMDQRRGRLVRRSCDAELGDGALRQTAVRVAAYHRTGHCRFSAASRANSLRPD